MKKTREGNEIEESWGAVLAKWLGEAGGGFLKEGHLSLDPSHEKGWSCKDLGKNFPNWRNRRNTKTETAVST